MKVLVVGGGGREHAIIRKLKESKKVDEIHALPGNGGMYKDAITVNIGHTTNGTKYTLAVSWVEKTNDDKTYHRPPAITLGETKE